MATKGRSRRSRRGSLQFWPRKRAKRIYPVVHAWAESNNVSLLGFAGYKVGMSHVAIKDSRANSVTKGDIIVWPASILECPPLKLFSIRLYKKGDYGRKLIGELVSNKLDKELGRKLKLAKDYKFEDKLKEIENLANSSDDIRVAVYTQPKKLGFGKKKPDIFEIAIGGKNAKDKFNYAKELIGRELRVGEFFKQWNTVDIHAVTKGFGFGGAIKRYGYNLKSHKSEKKRRAIGNLGSEGESKIRFTVGFPGQIGFHKRTEYNKMIVGIGDKPESINQKGGFTKYGNIKNDYVLIKGSVSGAVKRLVRFNEPIRGRKNIANVEMLSISTRSRQS